MRNELTRFRQKQARANRDGAGVEADALLEEVESPGAETEWESLFHAHLLRVALERIRPDFETHNWRAFELAWLENRPTAEVAQTLDMPASAVYVARWRIQKRLQQEILLLAEDVPHLVPPH